MRTRWDSRVGRDLLEEGDAAGKLEETDMALVMFWLISTLSFDERYVINEGGIVEGW